MAWNNGRVILGSSLQTWLRRQTQRLSELRTTSDKAEILLTDHPSVSLHFQPHDVALDMRLSTEVTCWCWRFLEGLWPRGSTVHSRRSGPGLFWGMNLPAADAWRCRSWLVSRLWKMKRRRWQLRWLSWLNQTKCEPVWSTGLWMWTSRCKVSYDWTTWNWYAKLCHRAGMYISWPVTSAHWFSVCYQYLTTLHVIEQS